ncbi:MAG: hypothetical protein KF901_21455 [Myxococcales bacterium]|nr:hypothetical protein [Myxococcales bacterium]
MVWVYVLVGLVVVGGATVLALGAKQKRDVAEAERRRGRAIGTWTIYYDVPGTRIGLVADFGEDELLRYLIFRAHDLFDYNQGLEGERRALAEALRAAAKGTPIEPWELLFPPSPEDRYHADAAPHATLFKFFEGTLYEGAITQPRFLGGDWIAKQKGLVGECVAIAAHLSRIPARARQVERAIEHLVTRELSEGTAPRGPRFWERANDALHEA